MNREGHAMRINDHWGDGRAEREFEECGLQCLTRTHELGHRCGYVALPEGHPLFGMGYDLVYDVMPELEVDGGVTFAQPIGDKWVLGWDAAHGRHRPDPSLLDGRRKELYEKRPDLFRHAPCAVMVDADMAEAETRRFARQLAEVVA